MKVVADTTVPYLKGVLEPLAEMSYLPSSEFTPEQIKDADALIVRSIDKCTEQLLQDSRVRLITSATIGFDHIDTHYCDRAGIVWKNSPGCNARSVAEYVLTSLVRTALNKGVSLKGKTIGIVGVGHVGRKVEELCSAYGMNILRNDPPRARQEGDDGFVSLSTLAKEADIITLHTPLTSEGEFPTYHLADADFFQSLERKPWLVNASRGKVHDTEALLEAKRNGKIGELIIDCWENEPNISRELMARAAIATPHIAGFSADGKANGTRMCLENISAFFHIEIERLKNVLPPAPQEPVIDLNRFGTHRIEHAMLHCFDPAAVDHRLRETPERFEAFRAHYNHPREFAAFTVIHATSEESDLLQQLGFTVR